MNQWINDQWINESINQFINQLKNQSVISTINQSTKRLITLSINVGLIVVIILDLMYEYYTYVEPTEDLINTVQGEYCQYSLSMEYMHGSTTF